MCVCVRVCLRVFVSVWAYRFETNGSRTEDFSRDFSIGFTNRHFDILQNDTHVLPKELLVHTDTVAYRYEPDTSREEGFSRDFSIGFTSRDLHIVPNRDLHT